MSAGSGPEDASEKLPVMSQSRSGERYPPSGHFQFAFEHERGGGWWLTDGYGYSKEVNLLTWAFYRTTRHRRLERWNRLLLSRESDREP